MVKCEMSRVLTMEIEIDESKRQGKGSQVDLKSLD
jgi:hypothetical protein